MAGHLAWRLAVNAATDAPLWTAFVLATGNTLEGVVAALVLRRAPQLDFGFRRVTDVLAFAGVAVLASPALSATIGTATLCGAGVQSWHRFAPLWFDWWLGDALGALIFAPVILTIAAGPAWERRQGLTLGAFVTASLVITHLAFSRLLGPGTYPLAYLVFPVVIAAALTGGPAVTAAVVLASSIVTIWNTLGGAGPFGGLEVHQSLVLLQTFTGVLAGTAMLLSAAIAERTDAELRETHSADALRHREEMLRLAQRAGGVATFEWDFQHQRANCSAEFFEMFGLSSRDGVMEGAEWGRFVHPDDRERMEAHLARALEGTEPSATDYRIIRADGVERCLMYAGQIRETPDGARMLGTVADITDRVRAEAALRESRDVLSLAMRGGAMGAWSRNLATNDVWWSRELEEIVGLAPGGFDRTEAGFFDVIDPDDRAAVRQAVDTAVETVSDYIVEFRFRHAGGEWRWMEGRGRAVYAADGTPLTLYGIGIDVTARKRAEAALRDAKEAAESASHLKDQFLATLSHELRTPLNAILGYARMLQTDAIAPEKRSRAIDVIERNAAAQNQLIEDLLDISRITRGQVRLEPAPTSIGAVLSEAVEGVRPAAEARRIALEVDIDPAAGMVMADSTRLQQVFWNLLTNAVKFTGQGGRTVASARRLGEDEVEVAVSDSGQGIAPDFLPFVFEPFRQGDAGLVRSHGGLGLGLAISRQLVELHGGTIRATSDGPGRGATFVVRLPRYSDAHAGAPAQEVPANDRRIPSIAGPIPLDGVDILLVDDEGDTLTMFRESLEAAGAKVRAVMTAADALLEYEERAPDLLVTDLGLPGMDGFELLQILRSRNPTLPAVAVTGYARLDDRVRALGAGFQAHFSTPIDPAAFVRALAATMSQPE